MSHTCPSFTLCDAPNRASHTCPLHVIDDPCGFSGTDTPLLVHDSPPLPPCPLCSPSPAGSPQFTAKLSKEQVEDLLASKAGDGVNFLQCARSSFVRSPLASGSAGVDELETRVVDGVDEIGADVSGNVDEIGAAVSGSIDEIGAAVSGSVDEIAAAVVEDGAAAVGQIPTTDDNAADDSSALRLKAAGTAVVLFFAAIGLGLN